MTNRTGAALQVLVGLTSVAEAARANGVPEAEVERWVAEVGEVLERGSVRPARRRPLAAAALLLGLTALGASQVASAQCSQVLPAGMRTFCAETPALADDVNNNFLQLVAFLQQKVGTVGSANITTGGTLTAPSVNANLTAGRVDAGVVNTGALISGTISMPTGAVNFGTTNRQMLNLYQGEHGVGVQFSTTYFRSSDSFSFFRGGAHADASGDPGSGGTRLATIDGAGNLNVTGELRANTLRQRDCNWVPTGRSAQADNQMHSVTCPQGRYAAGWQCEATLYLDGNCAVYCCAP